MVLSSIAFAWKKLINTALLKTALFFLFVGSSLALDAQTTNASPTPRDTTPPPTGPAATAPVVARETSLLSNGDFSAATNDPTWPDGWTHPQGATWKTENGFHYVHLMTPAPGTMVLMYRKISLPNPLPPGIELRVRVRYTDVKAGEKPYYDVRVISNFEAADGKGLDKDWALPVPSFLGTSTGWVDKSVFARIPPKARLVEIMPCIFHAASGTFDVARVEVFPATEDQLPKPPPVVPSATILPTDPKAVPPELHVVGEPIQQSILVAIEPQKTNVIRLSGAFEGDKRAW